MCDECVSVCLSGNGQKESFPKKTSENQSKFSCNFAPRRTAWSLKRKTDNLNSAPRFPSEMRRSTQRKPENIWLTRGRQCHPQILINELFQPVKPDTVCAKTFIMSSSPQKNMVSVTSTDYPHSLSWVRNGLPLNLRWGHNCTKPLQIAVAGMSRILYDRVAITLVSFSHTSNADLLSVSVTDLPETQRRSLYFWFHKHRIGLSSSKITSEKSSQAGLYSHFFWYVHGEQKHASIYQCNCWPTSFCVSVEAHGSKPNQW